MKLSWCDTTTIKPVISDAGRSFLDDIVGSKDSKVFLETKVRATHSGHLITGRCYTGWGMKAGTPTWYDMARGGKAGFDKPVIVDHDLGTPPLGRVVYAEYQQLKTGEAWLSDWKQPEEGPGKMGSGYVTTTSHIFDRDAITMIADGRYSTVSTRQVANDAWCSACGLPFEDGCEHEIGKTYDGVLCFAVTGLLDYVEMSFVNSPRQPNAKVISFKEMKDALSTKDPKGVILVGDCRYPDPVDSWTALRTQKDYEITINLADNEMPATGSITGRTKVSMAATKEVNLVGVEAARKAAETDNKPAPVEDNSTGVKSETKPLDFAFANLSRLWKDDLDLKTDMADSSYVMGITDKAAGHAHVFDGFIDTKNKVIRGMTCGTGQGKANESHCHSIWVEGMDMNESMVKGETRSASAGPDHTHSFSASMSDTSESHVTLVSGIDVIQDAINVLDDRVNKDTLEPSDKEKLLGGTKTKISWDAAHVFAARRLMGRLSASKRQEVLADLSTVLLAETEEETSMEKSTVDKLVNDLLADKARLVAQLADAVSVADAKETERQKLLDENVGLKASILNMKATLVVDARAKLTGTKLEDGVRKTSITELATKDEAALDALMDSEVLGNVRVAVVAPAAVAPVADKSKTVVDGAAMPAVNDTAKPKVAPSQPSKKSFASLDNRVSDKTSR